tara:strand:+ start:73 stop:276 length:204 start_codon:yes stop_codon:yes gene_type:complete
MFNKVNKIGEFLKNFEITTVKDQKKMIEIVQNIQDCLKMQNEMNIMVRRCIEELQTRIEKLEEDNEQ